ncbi:hypothetical protein, partial [Escherichia coli]|uniref:hypothetical protein n=1 Tax=Escherichia coli TaxID=562 RepID=UPI00227D9AE6
DVPAASPVIGPTPPSHGMPAFDVDVDVDSAGAGRSPADPPFPCARKRFHCFQQTVIPSPRQYHIAEQHAPAGDPC